MTTIEKISEADNAEITRIQISIASSIKSNRLPEGVGVYHTDLLTPRIINSLRFWELLRDVLEAFPHHAERLGVTIGMRRGIADDAEMVEWLTLILTNYGINAGPDTANRAFKHSDSMDVINGLRQYGRDFTPEQHKKLAFATGRFDSNFVEDRIISDFKDTKYDTLYSILTDSDLVDLVIASDWNTLNAIAAGVKTRKITRLPQIMAALEPDSSVVLSEGAL